MGEEREVDGVTDLVNETNEKLENQRYGRNKETLINKTYINSGAYRRKFNDTSDIPDVARSIYKHAKEALYHRSGTVFEDMYWFDSRTGEVIAKEVDSTEPREVNPSPKTRKIVSAYESDKIITLHTHPGSMPPSIVDFNTACKRGYGVCYVATHDGKLFGYNSHELISERLYGFYISEYKELGYSEFDTQVKAIQELMRNHKIDFWEVK